MKLERFLLLFCCFSFHFLSVDAAEKSQPPVWIAWDTQEGIARLDSSTSKANVWKLMRFYECQITPTYCGIASSVMALNSLSLKPAKGKIFYQSDLMSIHPEAINIDKVNERGLPLPELYEFLQAFPVKVTVFNAVEYGDEALLNILIHALRDSNQVVLALYRREEVMQGDGGGHWSPVAAYDEKSDSFLVMDVARWKYPPVWITSKAFIKSLKTTNVNGVSRGFLIVEKKTP